MTMCETYINFTEDFSYRLSEKRRMGWSRNGKTKSYICELFVSACSNPFHYIVDTV